MNMKNELFGKIVRGSIFFACLCAFSSGAGAKEALGQDCGKLKTDYDALLVEYNNVSAQAKAMMQYKHRVRELEDAYRQFGIVKEQLAKEKEAAIKVVDDLRLKIKELDITIIALTQDKENYKKSFEKASIENIIGEETKKQIEDFKKQGASDQETINILKQKIAALEDEALRAAADAELTARKLVEARGDFEQAKKKNKGLEKKLEEMPRNFAELARENKVLVKRTALMHYNLGVFYTQNREYQRAATEFEKAVELNPEDGSSHFNLGYLYAEQMQNRAKAVIHFKEFLKLAKKDDKDVDWAKRYILTWQTWEGSVPLK